MNEHFYLKSHPEELLKAINALDEDAFEPLSTLAYERYAIPKDVFARHCKRILLTSRHRYIRTRRISKFFPAIYFRLYYLLLKIGILLLPQHREDALTADVVFELWSEDGSSDYRFYKKIHAILKKRFSTAFAVLNIRRKVLQKNFHPRLFFFDFRIGARIAKELFKKEKWAIPPNSCGIDSYFLWSLFLRQYIVLRTKFDHIQAQVYITAGDNYLSPLKYWLMKKSGIRNVVSIQNGFRTDSLSHGGSYYSESDICEVFSQRQQRLMQRQGCRATVWLPMGNISTINELPHLKLRDDGPIVVIGHDFTYPIGLYNEEDFNRILSYVRTFSVNHKKLIHYKARTGSRHEQRNYEMHMESDWTVFDDTTDAYEAVASASVCVNYISTLGSEALGLGKRVLTFNVYRSDLVIAFEDGYGVVLSWDYSEFERKLTMLLSETSQKMSDYFFSLKKEIMAMDENVFNVIAHHCHEALENKNSNGTIAKTA